MGYTTDFYGDIRVEFPDGESMHKACELINGLANTRRMRRDLTKVADKIPNPPQSYGVEGEFFYPTEKWEWWACCGQTQGDPSVIDYNSPPATQPSLWLQWTCYEEGDKYAIIEWDQGEKFYCYTEWMQYIIDKIISPNGGVANGVIEWQGEDRGDMGAIVVTDNKVEEKHGRIEYE